MKKVGIKLKKHFSWKMRHSLLLFTLILSTMVASGVQAAVEPVTVWISKIQPVETMPKPVAFLEQEPYNCEVAREHPHWTNLPLVSHIIDVPKDSNGELYKAWRAADQDSRDLIVNTNHYKSYTFCPRNITIDGVTKDFQGDLVGRGQVNAAEIKEVALEDWQNKAITLINWIISIAAKVGVWLVRIAGALLGTLLAASRFITNPLVTSGWPFIQGIANLGFIIALLFIAATTTLRIEVGGGVKRLLPRLLLAALLINFSLVIGAVIIDASRLFMAVLANIMGFGEITNVGAALLNSSNLITSVYDLSSLAGEENSALATARLRSGYDTSWSMPFQVLQATILIWGLLFGMVVITIGLTIRYLALILLLIVSPIAYLAFAFPGMQQQAHKWWSTFLKYVIYGPVALFILLLLIVIPKGNVDIFGNSSAGEVSPMSLLVSVIITITMCILAAFAAKNVGAAGSAAAMSFALGQGKNALRGKGIAGVPMASSLWAGKKAVSPITDPIKRRWQARKQYQAEQEKVRQQYYKKKGGYDARLRAYEGKWETPQQRAAKVTETADTRAAVALAGGVAANLSNSAFTRSRLQQGHVIQAMGATPDVRDNNIDVVLTGGRSSQAQGIVSNDSYMREAMQNPARIVNIEAAILRNVGRVGGMSRSDASKIIEKMYDKIDELRKK